MKKHLVRFEAAKWSYPVRVFSFEDFARFHDWVKSSELMRDPLKRLAQLLHKALEISIDEAEGLVLIYGMMGRLPELVEKLEKIILDIGHRLAEQAGKNDGNG